MQTMFIIQFQHGIIQIMQPDLLRRIRLLCQLRLALRAQIQQHILVTRLQLRAGTINQGHGQTRNNNHFQLFRRHTAVIQIKIMPLLRGQLRHAGQNLIRRAVNQITPPASQGKLLRIALASVARDGLCKKLTHPQMLLTKNFFRQASAKLRHLSIGYRQISRRLLAAHCGHFRQLLISPLKAGLNLLPQLLNLLLMLPQTALIPVLAQIDNLLHHAWAARLHHMRSRAIHHSHGQLRHNHAVQRFRRAGAQPNFHVVAAFNHILGNFIHQSAFTTARPALEDENPLHPL